MPVQPYIPYVPTNLFAMPLVTMTVQTGANEDWVSAIRYTVDASTMDPPPLEDPQLDLRGIRFEMEVRPTVPSHDVVITASTDDGSLTIGFEPDYGFFLFRVPWAVMQKQFPGHYAGEVRGTDAFGTRRVIVVELEIVEGVVRP